MATWLQRVIGLDAMATPQLYSLDGINRRTVAVFVLVNQAGLQHGHLLEGELTKSGFFAISHYIRTKEDKEAVKKAMMEQMRKIGPDGQPLGPVSEEERQFMGDVPCGRE